ncbi:hypothetical protein ACF0H5_022980 [Mactra antiquata]
MPITKQLFGTTDAGVEIYQYCLKNDNNYEVKIITYGGIVTNIFAPDKQGNISDIVLGFDSFDGYKVKHPYFGALIGRYGNRIGNAKFSIDGSEYNLAPNNNNKNALHGGLKGFDKQVWDAAVEGDKLVLTYVSPDGEEGYPGELTTVVSYQLTSDNKLILNYWAATNKSTIVNLTNHSYFNLGGHESGIITDHNIRINAEHFTPTDELLIPTGKLEAVKDGPMDLTNDVLIGDRLDKVPGGFGFDHNYCLGNPATMKHVARVSHEKSGRVMNVHSTEPGVQFYTGSNLSGIQGKNGAIYNKYSAFCLEAQHYPDSPNKDNFPSVILRPGENYMQTTIYEFGVTA